MRISDWSSDVCSSDLIDQSACNKDYSCANGFCPSFVELDHAELRKPEADHILAVEAARFGSLPDPRMPALERVTNIYIAGIGGLGVLTVGALLGAAAHIEGLSATVDRKSTRLNSSH